MTPDSAPVRSHRLAAAAWFGLMLLTLWWDWLAAPLHNGIWLPLIKLLPLLLAARGILSGKIYTYQYASMLVLFYFTEGVMRLFDAVPASRWFAAAETALSVLFFVLCLAYLKQFKNKRKP
ncbi:DUF2069 domain-containing protein [Kingella sp. SNUBH-2017]|jgi:hypothetical protein|uniref:DUF2069 domain-containing protein n=1 Tax=Kingella sp. SNUBH-2017 TaxID=2994077 RepID=UPI0023636D1D|nr:DUF2069 domain-containing protein [Kingella sp. SNUBH-2017]MDD2183342.1 DUF2069 domain-containing protein [Kingella sp. SNUBH-2017]